MRQEVKTFGGLIALNNRTLKLNFKPNNGIP